MSVASKNMFSVLEEDSSSRPPSPPPAPPAIPAKSPTAPAARRNQRERGKGPAARGGQYYARGGGTNKPADATRDPASTTAEEPAAGAETKRRFDGERRDGRGRGRGARGGGGGGGGGGRGRTFDRHSATGKTDSDKKVHQSWGGDDGDTELKVEEAAGDDAAKESNANDWGGFGQADTAGDGWGAPPAEEAPPAQVNGEGEQPDSRRRNKEEEEDNTLTLEQYLAQQKEKESAVVPKLETRKANEGADDAIWAGATLHQKGEGESYFTGKTKNTAKARTEKKEKVYLEIDAHFERPSRGGRGRGGDRGERDRGRGGRGRSRGGAFSASTPLISVDDEAAFPSLS
ncbi:hypothetical protein SCLCIDRAFT_14528 [Scleroderma citrinum Foug A]|uniref:Hyaluronan/mRNA-binding protein domain-containing protein n=1 Tax=Scleroderma citrinum Foug A TaxID=1036808 RepID=A0A0C3EE33_9AGAM|nr:hypothetical protein SCLCIDRAFT_14528 [Scleroderma citrinum Foug A]